MQYGFKGVALASTISYIVCTIAIIIIFRRLTGISLKDITLVKKEDIKIYTKSLRNIKSKLLNRDVKALAFVIDSTHQVAPSPRTYPDQ